MEKSRKVSDGAPSMIGKGGKKERSRRNRKSFSNEMILCEQRELGARGGG